MKPLKILSIKSAFYTPMLLTAHRFLPAAGVSTELVLRTSEDVSSMLRNGELDFAQFAPSAAMVDRSKGIEDNPIHIASINERDGFLLVSRKPEPDFKWSDLTGKTIVPANFATQPEACLRFALHRQNVDINSVALITGLDGMAAAAKTFKEGTGDYVQLQDPMARQLIADGHGYLAGMFGEAIGPIAFSSVATGQHMVLDHPDTVTQFMQAYSQTRHWLAQSDAATITDAIAHWFTETPRQVLEDAVAGYLGLGTWTERTAIRRADFETAIDMMTFSASLTGVTNREPFDLCCNDSFAAAVDNA
ncbi:MAG: ABC transporter substrate-binding protein [Burkholderiaceae bacterium]